MTQVFLMQVPFARSSLNHDDVFILDTQNKIYQFNGANSNIQERAKALEVIQLLKEKYHEGKCDVAIVGKGSHVFVSLAEKPTMWFWILVLQVGILILFVTVTCIPHCRWWQAGYWVRLWWILGSLWWFCSHWEEGNWWGWYCPRGHSCSTL